MTLLATQMTQTNTPYKPSRIVPPPRFYTKCPKRIPKMTRFKLFAKRKSSLYQSTKNYNNTANTSALQNSILPCYSNVNSNPNVYALKSHSVNDEKWPSCQSVI